MNHPLTFDPPFRAPEAPRRDDAALAPVLRSEAFPEDLGLAGAFEPENVPPRYRRYVALVGLLRAAPLGLALVGAVMVLFGHPV